MIQHFRVCLSIAAFGFLAAAPLSSAPSPTFKASTPEERAEALESGRVVVRDLTAPGSAVRVFEASALCDADAAEMTAFLTDYEAYPSFLSSVEDIDVIARNGDLVQANYRVVLPFGIKKKYRLELRNDIGADRAVLSWKQIPWPGLKQSETIVDTTGYWLLEAYAEDPSKLLVVYHVETDPGPVPPLLSWIVDHLMKNSLPEVVESARNLARGPAGRRR